MKPSNENLIAVDLAKCVFEVAVSNQPKKVDERHRLSREKFLAFFVNRPKATVVMEACGTAHFWGRKLTGLGHTPVLLPPQYVRPYVRRNKTDQADAEGMLEAYRNADIRPVPVKTLAQQTLIVLHRMRSAWLAERTARVNTLRGLLRELGFVIPLGVQQVLPRVWEVIGDADNDLPDPLRPIFAEACNEIRDLDGRIAMATEQIAALAEQTPLVQLLLTIPGIGLLTATALVACLGDVSRFPSARHLASYLGLTPREYSSASRRHLGHISKRGDGYLRMLLIHGARSVLLGAQRTKTPDRLRSWALRLRQTQKHNIVAVALANKLARIAWAVWKHRQPFVSSPAPEQTAAA